MPGKASSAELVQFGAWPLSQQRYSPRPTLVWQGAQIDGLHGCELMSSKKGDQKPMLDR